MKWLSRCSLLVLLCVAGCATLNRTDRYYLQDHSVPPVLYTHMLHGEPLSLGEIATLSQHHVSAGFIIHYLNDTGAVYRLSTDDVMRLRQEGVSREVIDYLLDTPSLYAPRPYVYGGPWYPADFYYGAYCGPAWHSCGHPHRW